MEVRRMTLPLRKCVYSAHAPHLQRAGYVDFMKENVDVHVVACLLKEYIRSLAEPPVPFSLYDPLMECLGTSTPPSPLHA
jgi:hypothetical protein